MIDWETFQTAYQTADENIKRVIDSGQVSVAIDERLPQLDQNQRRIVIQAISAYVLQTHPTQAVVAYLQQNNVSVMEELLNEITLSATTKAAVPAEPAEVSPVIPVRTMADDVANAQGEPTYASSQDNLIKPPAATPVPPPAPTMPTPPTPPTPPIPPTSPTPPQQL